MTAVGLPCIPILCSMEAQIRSLRAPRLPSVFTRNFGTTNSEMPFTPAGASGSRASTRWTMFSAMSCSPQVMKILGAGNEIRAIRLRNCLAADLAQVGTGLRLGQVHGAGPLAFDHLVQVSVLDLIGSVMRKASMAPKVSMGTA